MSILLIGVHQRSGSLDMLERISVPSNQLGKAVETLGKHDNIREVVLLSTCNRTEIYAVTEKFHGAFTEVRDFLCQIGDLEVDQLQPHLYSEHDESAVRHLFEVAAGLDSAVLGESEILGQVRDAWKLAEGERTARSVLNLLFRHALQVGKKARSSTDIGRGTASVSHAAVEMAVEHRGELNDARVAVIGAGAMGAGIAVALKAHGAADVSVVTRNAERGQSLAERVGGTALGFEHLGAALRDADVILTGTSSPTPVINAGTLAGHLDTEHPKVIIDVAVPRDVEPDVAALDGVTVFDLDDLAKWADQGRERRVAEVAAVQELVSDAVNQFSVELVSLQAGPVIGALRDQAEIARQAELQRFARELDRLSPDQRELVEAITRGTIAKFLHEPSTRLRQQAGTPQGERNAAAVADLFDLG